MELRLHELVLGELCRALLQVLFGKLELLLELGDLLLRGHHHCLRRVDAGIQLLVDGVAVVLLNFRGPEVVEFIVVVEEVAARKVFADVPLGALLGEVLAKSLALAVGAGARVVGAGARVVGAGDLALALALPDGAVVFVLVVGAGDLALALALALADGAVVLVLVEVLIARPDDIAGSVASARRRPAPCACRPRRRPVHLCVCTGTHGEACICA